MSGFRLSSGVGNGLANKPLDVAFIQMALKLAPKGQYGSAPSKSYWPGRIDGKFSHQLGDAIYRFKSEHFSEAEWRSGPLLNDPLRSIRNASSKTYSLLLGLLSAAYKIKDYNGLYLNNYYLLFQRSGNSARSINSKPEILGLPNVEAAKLLEHMQSVAKGYGIVPAIKKIRVDHHGRFMVHLNLSHGRVIHPHSGQIMPADGAQKAAVISGMASFVNNPTAVGVRRWEAFGRQKLLLRTVKKYPELTLTAGAKTWVRWQLGAHKTQMQAEAVERALDLYEFYRIGGQLNQTEAQFLIETFGEDWQKIKEKQAIKERIASQHKQELERLVQQRDYLKDIVLRGENEVRHLLGIPDTDLIGRLGEELVAFLAPKGAKSGTKKIVKSSRRSEKSKLEQQRDDQIADNVGSLVAAPVGTVLSGGDVLDALLLGATVVGLVLLVVGTAGTGAVALGVAATALRVAVVAGRTISTAVEAIELSRLIGNIVELVQDVLEDAERAKNIEILGEKLISDKNNLDATLQQIQNIAVAIQAEELLTLPDFGFPLAELKEGAADVQRLVSVSSKP